MADYAYQTQYRQEFIKGFERRQSRARSTVTTEIEVKGNSAVFLVADSGSATAVTRGVNGDIPTRPDNLTQYTATLQEWHDVPERTNFNIFASQGDGRRIMQETSMAVINRKIDDDIITALSAATVTLTMTQTSAATFLADLLDLSVTLAEANADEDAQISALVTPAFFANMMTIPQVSSGDYVRNPIFPEGMPKSTAWAWNGVNWIRHTGLSGMGSSSTCYIYSKNAIGHACDMERIITHVGYDEKNDKSWARCTTYMGSKLLQNSGVVKITHADGTIIGA